MLGNLIIDLVEKVRRVGLAGLMDWLVRDRTRESIALVAGQNLVAKLDHVARTEQSTIEDVCVLSLATGHIFGLVEDIVPRHIGTLIGTQKLNEPAFHQVLQCEAA